ncbi:MAG: transposase [Clostridia bacterium]|nr:transposase [Clostridia bacterium]
MDAENKLPDRKPTRLKNFDYSTNGAYFITICTQNRRKILSIVGGDVLDAPCTINLLPYGIIADKYINQLNDFYENIEIDSYVIMPNHIHILMRILNEDSNASNDGASRTSPPTIVSQSRQHSTVSSFVSTFKRFCNKEYGTNIWQRHFYDHIIRNLEDYRKHKNYILENPRHWHLDELDSQDEL